MNNTEEELEETIKSCIEQRVIKEFKILRSYYFFETHDGQILYIPKHPNIGVKCEQ